MNIFEWMLINWVTSLTNADEAKYMVMDNHIRIGSSAMYAYDTELYLYLSEEVSMENLDSAIFRWRRQYDSSYMVKY